MKVLVVDIDPVSAELTKQMLERDGIVVQVERELKPFAGVVAAFEAAVLLIDVKLEYRAHLGDIRRFAKRYDIPVVAFTAVAGDVARIRLEDAGCKAVIRKPLGILSLASKVREVVAWHGKRPPAEAMACAAE